MAEILKFTIKVFLSYSTKDLFDVNKFYYQLKNYPMLSIFMAPQDIPAGVKGSRYIIKKIKECDIFLIYGTKNYHESNFTEQEAGVAWAFNKKIIPLVPIEENENIKGNSSEFQIKNIPDGPSSLTGIVAAIYSETIQKDSEFVEYLLQNSLKLCRGFTEAQALNYLIHHLCKTLTWRETEFVIEAYLQNPQVRSYSWISDMRQLDNKDKPKFLHQIMLETYRVRLMNVKNQSG